MIRSGAKLISLAALPLALIFAAEAADARPVPKLRSRITDEGGFLSGADRFRLDQRLAAYEAETGHQFVLLTVDSLDGDPIEDFSIRVADEWKIGAKGRDDGLILILAKQDRKSRIEVGPGLQGAIPDVIANRILDDVLKPKLKAGENAAGIFAAFDKLMEAAKDESRGASPTAGRSRRRGRSPGILLLLLAAIALPFIIARAAGGKLGGSSLVGGIFGFTWGLQHGLTIAIVCAILGSVLGIFFIGGGGGGFYGGGYYGGGGFGGGGFGGGGGGGFGGGGGGFDGGGASGDW